MDAIFEASVTPQGQVRVTRKNLGNKPPFVFELSSNEGDRATSLINTALRMGDIDPLPDHITNSPFVVRFFPRSGCALERTDNRSSIPFRPREGDELIRIIQQGVAMAINWRQRQGPAPAASVGSYLAANEVV